MNIQLLGFSPDVEDIYRRSGLNPTDADRAVLQIAGKTATPDQLSDLPLVYHVSHSDYSPIILKKAATAIVPTWWVADALRLNYGGQIAVIPPGLTMSQWYVGVEADDYVLWEDIGSEHAVLFRQVTRRLHYQRFLTTSDIEGGPNVTNIGTPSFADWAHLLRRSLIYISTLTESYYPERIAYALAAGVPVIVLNYSFLNELVQHGHNGIMSIPTVDAFTHAYTYARQHRHILGRNGVARLAEADWLKVLPRYQEVYTRVARGLRPLGVTFYLLYHPSINLNAWVDYLLGDGTIDELVIIVPYGLEGVRIGGHTLHWLKRETDLYGGYVKGKTRIRVTIYANYPPQWVKLNRIPTTVETKYFAYNTEAQVPSTKLNHAVSVLESNPGLGTITEGVITIKQVPSI